MTPASPLVDVSIVITLHNQAAYTQQMLASLARNSAGVRYELIFVDNCSTDESVSLVGMHTPGQKRGKAQGKTPPVRVQMLHNPVPRALSASWNMGAKAAIGRHIILANNDVLFTPGSLCALIDTADKEPQAGIVIGLGPMDTQRQKARLLPPLTVDAQVTNIVGVEEWGRARLKEDDASRLDYIDDPYLPQGGYFFLITRACIEKVGLADPAYELTGEDWDWFARIRRWFKIVRTHNAYIEHYEHTSCLTLSDEYHDRLMHGRFLLTEKQEGCPHIFTVIMPTYERVDTLKAAIDSVLAQTFPNWRLIVVDDGSKDWDQVDKMARQYYSGASNRIWFRHIHKNGGPGAARNYGLARARGKYVAFLDSDDVWKPNHLQKHFAAHESGNWAMVYSDPEFAWRTKNAALGRFLYRVDDHPTIKYFGDFDKGRLARENYIQTSGVSVWGDLARSLRFPDRTTHANDCEEDWEYFLAVTDAGGAGRPVKHIAEKTCRYHWPDSAHEQEHLISRITGVVNAPHRDVETLIAPSALGGDALPPALPKIGVVIPTKDRPDDLRRALKTIGRKTPCVVVDDGGFYASTAFDTVARVNAAEDADAALLRTNSSRGASWARNRGVEMLQSEWVQFLDDDDLLTSDWRESLLPQLVDGIDGVISSAFVPNAPGPGMRIDDEVYTSQVCLRRSAMLEAGMFRESLTWAEERELIERMERMGMKIVRTGRPLVYRPSRGGSGDPNSAAPVPAFGGQGWALGKSGF